MKAKTLTAVATLVLAFTLFVNRSSAAVFSYTSNNITITVCAATGPGLMSPNRPAHNQNTMSWLQAPSHPYSKSGMSNTPAYYVRDTPDYFNPYQDIVRPGDVIFSSTTNFTLWNCLPSPSGIFSNEVGGVFEGPVKITTTGGTLINPSNVVFEIRSSDFYNAFGYTGRLNIDTSVGTGVQKWSTTCVGKDGTNTYTSGDMVNPITQLYYSGPTYGFSATNMANQPYGVAYASNYLAGYNPLFISITYKVLGASNNVLCQATAWLSTHPQLHVMYAGGQVKVYAETQDNDSLVFDHIPTLPENSTNTWKFAGTLSTGQVYVQPQTNAATMSSGFYRPRLTGSQ